MKQHFIIKNNQKHLLLFFAGWGMDETPFLQIHPTNKDWLICYDYRSLEFDAIKSIPKLPSLPGPWEYGQLLR
jgi:biotin synthesis protein BioG